MVATFKVLARDCAIFAMAVRAGITPQLTTMLGNASFSLSDQLWQFYAQARAGMVLGSYDLTSQGNQIAQGSRHDFFEFGLGLSIK